jgi:hypothetical protein
MLESKIWAESLGSFRKNGIFGIRRPPDAGFEATLKERV